MSPVVFGLDKKSLLSFKKVSKEEKSLYWLNLKLAVSLNASD